MTLPKITTLNAMRRRMVCHKIITGEPDAKIAKLFNVHPNTVALAARTARRIYQSDILAQLALEFVVEGILIRQAGQWVYNKELEKDLP